MPRRKASPHKPLPSPIAEAIARKLRAAREAAGLTQEALAAQSGVSVQLIRRLEAANANTTLGTLHAVSGALATTLTELPDGH